jgi:hypothetical protein
VGLIEVNLNQFIHLYLLKRKKGKIIKSHVQWYQRTHRARPCRLARIKRQQYHILESHNIYKDGTLTEIFSLKEIVKLER